MNKIIQIRRPGNKSGALNGIIKATKRKGIGKTFPNNANLTLAFLFPFLNVLSPIIPKIMVPKIMNIRIKSITNIVISEGMP
jgi:hypothetical protein